MVFKTVGITARTDKKEALTLAARLLDYVRSRDLKAVVDPEVATHIGSDELAAPLKEWKPGFIITIGGDGTILRTCIHIPKPEPPILAINMGERGFLTEAPPEDAFSAVDKSLKGEFTFELCKKISATIGGKELPDALNEIYISADAPVKLLYAIVWKNGERVFDCKADGLIIASQTGSTGYSAAASGPVLDPESNVFLMTPVCPLAPFPPLVFPEDSKLLVEVERPKTVSIVVDGYYRELIKDQNPRITITKSGNTTTFIRFKKEFYGRLKSRLLYPTGERC